MVFALIGILTTLTLMVLGFFLIKYALELTWENY